MCYDTLKAMGESSGGKANSEKKAPPITKEQKYKDLIRGLEMRKENSPDFPLAPWQRSSSLQFRNAP